MTIHLKRGLLTVSAFIMAGFWVSLAHPEVVSPFGRGAAVALKVMFAAVIAGLLALSVKKN